MSDLLVIQSHKGPYSVVFDGGLPPDIGQLLEGTNHFLVDANVARLYEPTLHSILQHQNAIVIDATEENKSLEKTVPVFEKLVLNKVRRDHTLIAIGGGVIQDITCFVASTLLRGIPWRFIPTTLLAQADSCIGSKSSINLGAAKNILGTFYPPQAIYVYAGFLETLEQKDIQSGIGEIIKVHAIDGISSFDRLAADFDRLRKDRSVLLRYVRDALLIKQRFIEEDEFDRGIRNIFNYGHSFGHAIESATHYVVPHGIAVTMGMDMANYIAADRGLLPIGHCRRMHSILQSNYCEYAKTRVPLDALLFALMKDKKNTGATLGLIFPMGERAEIQKVQVASDEVFRSQCGRFLEEMCG